MKPENQKDLANELAHQMSIDGHDIDTLDILDWLGCGGLMLIRATDLTLSAEYVEAVTNE